MSGWNHLLEELDRWAAEGRTATFWWRDDDAGDVTPALERLRQTAADIPVALAVVPAAATSGLADTVGRLPGWRTFQHGWRHANHACPGEKKAEFGAHRPVPAMLADLEHGQRRMSVLFGEFFLPVLVPPWNRIDAALIERLAGAGYRGLSTFAGRGATRPGLVCRDCHLDPIDWRGNRAFVGTAPALTTLVAHLRRRRHGNDDRPTGLLTHHLVMDEASWAFCASLRERTTLHTGVRWISPNEAFEIDG